MIRRIVRPLLLVLASALGWWCASMIEPGSRRGETAQSGPRRPPRIVENQGSWERGLAMVRATAPSRSEEAWILWADAVPDDQIPAAIDALDGAHDFTPLQVLFARWARIDPQAALQSWRDKGILNFQRVPMEMGAQPITASSHLQTHPRRHVGGALLRAWASVAPMEAARFALESLDGAGRRDGDFHSWDLDRVAGLDPSAPERDTDRLARLAHIDTAQAAAEALALPSTERRAFAARSVLAAWMKFDPAAAEAWYWAWPPEVKSAVVTENMHFPMQAAPSDVKTRIWADRLPATAGPGQLLAANAIDRSYSASIYSKTAAALAEWAGRDPAAARGWVQSHEATPTLRGFLHGHLAGGLVATGRTAEAVSIVNEVPDADKALAVAPLVQAWSRIDAHAAADWAARIPDPEIRDASIGAIAESVGTDDLTWAADLASRIENDSARHQAIERLRHQSQWSAAASNQLPPAPQK